MHKLGCIFCGELEAHGKLGLHNNICGSHIPYGGDRAVGREVGNIGEFNSLQKKAISTVVEIWWRCAVGLLDNFDGELLGWSEDGSIGSDTIAFDVGGFDFVGERGGGDVSESEMGGGLSAGGYGKDDRGWRVGK